MRQHTFCYTVFIIIFGLICIGTVDAATITEDFNSDPGWTSFNLPVNNNDFGFRNSDIAGGDLGEAGGFFSKTDEVAWYGNDTIGNFTGDDTLSASGLMNIYNMESGYNNNIHIGHFDRSAFTPGVTNGIGFQILEPEENDPDHFLRIYYMIGNYEGLLFKITGTDELRTWSYLYDPDDDSYGSYGSLTVSISGSDENVATVFLSEDERNSIGDLNTFGLAEKNDGATNTSQCEFYIDNVSYTTNIGSGTVINKGVTIKSGAVIGENVILNKDSTVGENTEIGDNTVINRNVTIGSDVEIGENVTIGQKVTIGNGVTIGDNTVINQGTFIEDDATIGTNVVLGRDVTVKATADVADDTVVPKDTVVGVTP